MPLGREKNQHAANLWWRRIGWLLALWLAGVLAVTLVALAFRAVMGAIGLTR